MKWTWIHSALTLMLLTGLVLSILTESFAYQTNGEFGFPLDDPWIHLQFAKNLHDYGSFSYFKDEAVTAGSTAPLYTLLLAVGFFITSNEMVLSYALGVLFFLLGGFYFFRLTGELFPGRPVIILAGTILFMTEPRLQWIALSGMETTLFVALLLGVLYHYLKRDSFATGILSGLLLWTRPEAVILSAAILGDLLYNRLLAKREERGIPPWPWKAGVVFAVMGAAYGAFNLALSGSLLPNTYAAKLKYYSAGGEAFPGQVFHFLADGHMIIISIFAALGIFSILRSFIFRERNTFSIPLLFSAGLFFAYWLKLPYLYQNGRYLMPVLPFVLLIGLHGVEKSLIVLTRFVSRFSKELNRSVATAALLAVASLQFVQGTWESRILYQDYCRYINQRQVRTAKWMRDNLSPSAVVATHDVGAIAFYSGRKIVDMVGLISPQVIESIGNLDGLKTFMSREGTTHLALLRSWFEVVNVNPVFQTDERFPEIMEVFEYDPARIHFTAKGVNWFTENGWRAVAAGNLQQGGPMLEEAVRRDPRSSRAHLCLGKALLLVGDLGRAEQEVRKAVELHPTFWDAQLTLALVALKRDKQREAIDLLERLIKGNSSFASAYQLLGEIYKQSGNDPKKAEHYFEQYRQLVKAGAVSGG